MTLKEQNKQDCLNEGDLSVIFYYLLLYEMYSLFILIFPKDIERTTKVLW